MATNPNDKLKKELKAVKKLLGSRFEQNKKYVLFTYEYDLKKSKERFLNKLHDLGLSRGQASYYAKKVEKKFSKEVKP